MSSVDAGPPQAAGEVPPLGRCREVAATSGRWWERGRACACRVGLCSHHCRLAVCFDLAHIPRGSGGPVIMGGPGSGARRTVTAGMSDDERRQYRLEQKRTAYRLHPSTIERRELELATRGEVTSYRHAEFGVDWGVEWVAVCRVCDASRAEFGARVDAARWLVGHRATAHALPPAPPPEAPAANHSPVAP